MTDRNILTKQQTLDQLHSVYSRFCAWTREEVPEYMGGKLQQDIIDALLAAARAIDQLPDEPPADPMPAGYIECGNCKSRFLSDRRGESCAACGHTLNRTPPHE